MNLPIHRYGWGEALFQRHSQALTTRFPVTSRFRLVSDIRYQVIENM